MQKQFFIVLFFICAVKLNYGQSSVSDTLDITHATIRMDMTDFAGKTIAGNTELALTALADDITVIPLDLQQLNVDSVLSGSLLLPFAYDGYKLIIDLPETLNTGDTISLTIFYNGEPDKDLSWGGWYWSGDYSFQLGVGFDADPHNFGRIWFPCFDNFKERSTFRYEITTPSGYKAFCGGLLESETDNGDSTTTWIWNCNQTIPSYLASVAVSTYATVEYNYSGILETIPIQLAAKATDTTKLKNSFIHLTDALSIFENAYGYYKWDRVGYAVVPFSGGAMEHAMNIAYPLFAVTGTTVWEDLMVHELAHSWWGNLITCADEKEMYLNEGMAEYSVVVFREQMYGEQNYKDMVNANHLEIIHYGFSNDGGNYFALADMPHDHTYGFSTYNKGALVAHNLRGYMGDEMFFECAKGFLTTYAFQPVSSEQFRDYLSECSGTDMTPFFDGWIFNAGMPAFELQSFGYMDVAGGTDICIQQKLNHAPGLFNAVPLEISWVNDAGEELFTQTVTANGEFSEFSIGTGVYEPYHLIIDRQNKIADAVTAEEFYISSTGSYTSDYGKINFEVNAVDIDTAWMRVEHYWVGADGFRNAVPGLHVNTQRYWRIMGGYNADNISATLKYNGTTSTSGGYLDNEFISNSDDSLVLLFRADPQAEWTIYPYYELDVWAITTDKRGAFELSKLQQGEYAIGMYNAALLNQPDDINYCAWIPDAISETQGIMQWEMYPNPANDFFILEFSDKFSAEKITVYNSNGIPIYSDNSVLGDNLNTIPVKTFPPGLYNVCVTSSEGFITGQKLLIIR